MFKDGQALRRAAVAVPIAVGLTAVAFTGTVSAASKTVTCERRGFVAAVRYGTNFGLAVSGTLRLKVKPSGDVSGTITNNAKKRFRVVGHVAGRAINLLIRYRDTGWIAGTGTLERPIERCSGFIGGTFAGPSDGDFGDWSDTQSFGNGMQSMGSPPLGQNLPVIKNPHWDSGRLILSSDAA